MKLVARKNSNPTASTTQFTGRQQAAKPAVGARCNSWFGVMRTDGLEPPELTPAVRFLHLFLFLDQDEQSGFSVAR